MKTAAHTIVLIRVHLVKIYTTDGAMCHAMFDSNWLGAAYSISFQFKFPNFAPGSFRRVETNFSAQSNKNPRLCKNQGNHAAI